VAAYSNMEYATYFIYFLNPCKLTLVELLVKMMRKIRNRWAEKILT